MPTELTRDIRDKRIAVARDVIARLDLGKLCVEKGSYVRGNVPIDILAEEIRDVVDQVESNCRVCALGALMLSRFRVMDGNDLRVEDITDRDADGDVVVWADDSQTWCVLGEIFDAPTMTQIEDAFEMWSDDGAAAFGSCIPNPDDRLRAIMTNLIQNDGEFLPD